MKPLKYPKKQIKQAKQDNKAHGLAQALLQDRFKTAIDEKLEELKEQEKNAVGSKLTATLKGQNLLHELKAKIILA